ncbi:hypothetical protein CYJ10_14220 [Cupriavidus pauculus]|uniref:Uncharacterized protein n=1 Tax=Cupriavidus pauculus TaxID=82633 RepID=A0A2N5CD49_9BURK|nr:hypothetical protein CYJ10_14220 [Cupriavidus pauculus]
MTGGGYSKFRDASPVLHRDATATAQRAMRVCQRDVPIVQPIDPITRQLAARTLQASWPIYSRYAFSV